MDLARRLGGTELYDCRSCAARPALYAALGHNGPPQQYWQENLLSDETLARCPVRDLLEAPEHLTNEVARYVGTYYPAYRDGHLLVAGGIADQPARYLNMVRLIASLEAQAELKYDELTKEEK